MKKHTALYTALVVILAVLIFININTGSIRLSLGEILRIILSHDTSSVSGSIIWDIRLPRIAAALLLGGALSVSGYMLQTFFHNPIAGPFVLGISSGAKLIVAIIMVASITYGFHVNSLMMIVAAFVGATLVTLFVLAVSNRVRHMSVLIVCGVMVGYICSAVTELIISFADDANIVNLHSWSMGSFSAITWKNVSGFMPVIFVCLIIGMLMTKQMEAYSYGESYAASLGINVRLFRIILITVSGILSATVTAFAGPISFVGIAVPHIIRITFKTDRPVVVIPAVFLSGSIFCLLSDMLARIIFAPTELSISTVTAILGAPVVIAMLLKRKRGE